MNPDEKSVTRLVRGLIVDEREDEKEVVEVIQEAASGFCKTTQVHDVTSPTGHLALRSVS